MDRSNALRLTAQLLALAASLVALPARALMPPPKQESYGVIDRAGTVIIYPACDGVTGVGKGDWISLFRDGKQGFANLRTGQTTGLVFDGGQDRPQLFFDGPPAPLFARGPEPVRRGAMFGYVDSVGQTVIPFSFSTAGQFSSDGLAIAGQGGKVGFIDRKGNFVVPPIYQAVRAFDEHGLAIVLSNGLWGAIDRRGRFVVPAEYKVMLTFSKSGLALVTNGRSGADTRWGAVDTRGKLTVPIKFGILGEFSANGLAGATLDTAGAVRHWGFVDRTGSFVIPPNYVRVGEFDPHIYAIPHAPPGLAEVVSADSVGAETTQYVDRQGRTVLTLPQGLNGGLANENGTIVVSRIRNGQYSPTVQWGLFDSRHPDREPIWLDGAPDKFDSAGMATILGIAQGFGGGWGYINTSGKTVIPIQFVRASGFGKDGLAAVTVKGPRDGEFTAAFIDRTGTTVLKTPFKYAMPFSDSGFSMVSVERTVGEANPYPADACRLQKQ